MASWESLTEPIRIGSLTAKNRIEAAPDTHVPGSRGPVCVS